MSERVTLVDVTLRDGLQDEHKLVATAEKLRLARSLAKTGMSRVEATSFVSPKWVPQLADAEDLVLGWKDLPLRPAALMMNRRGFERARLAFERAGFAEGSYDLVFVVSASGQHNRSNNNRTTEQTMEIWDEIATIRGGVSVHGAIACAFASPYEGEVIDRDEVVSIARRLVLGGASHVAVCDTVGQGKPEVVEATVGAVAAATGTMPTLHLHDLGGRAAANVVAGLEAGVRTFEGVLGGIGGCPFAPGAPGNTDLLRLHDQLTAAGYVTGLDRAALVEAAMVLREVLASAPDLPRVEP
jgi:hydroxymethylglutaryl-CoA lyase